MGTPYYAASFFLKNQILKLSSNHKKDPALWRGHHSLIFATEEFLQVAVDVEQVGIVAYHCAVHQPLVVCD